jgi:DNA-binding transcriptional ArsR family regulator
MPEPLSDRLFDALGDPVARGVVRLILEEERCQAALLKELDVAQATVSRAVKQLRAVGLIASVTQGRAPALGVPARREASALLMAADRLAEELLALDRKAQAELSQATRRGAIRPMQDVGDGATDEKGDR